MLVAAICARLRKASPDNCLPRLVYLRVLTRRVPSSRRARAASILRPYAQRVTLLPDLTLHLLTVPSILRRAYLYVSYPPFLFN